MRACATWTASTTTATPQQQRATETYPDLHGLTWTYTDLHGLTRTYTDYADSHELHGLTRTYTDFNGLSRLRGLTRTTRTYTDYHDYADLQGVRELEQRLREQRFARILIGDLVGGNRARECREAYGTQRACARRDCGVIVA